MIEILKEDYKEYTKLHNILIKYYRKRYSTHVPFKIINTKIQRKWQLYKYKKSQDNIVERLENLKLQNYVSTIRWRDDIADVKTFI